MLQHIETEILKQKKSRSKDTANTRAQQQQQLCIFVIVCTDQLYQSKQLHHRVDEQESGPLSDDDRLSQREAPRERVEKKGDSGVVQCDGRTNHPERHCKCAYYIE